MALVSSNSLEQSTSAAYSNPIGLYVENTDVIEVPTTGQLDDDKLISKNKEDEKSRCSTSWEPVAGFIFLTLAVLLALSVILALVSTWNMPVNGDSIGIKEVAGVTFFFSIGIFIRAIMYLDWRKKTQIEQECTRF